MQSDNLFQTFSKETKTIFGIIQKKGEVTKKELCEITNNNITTLNRLFQPLEDYKLVIESGSGDSIGGRRPKLYSINTSGHYVGAVNIASTYYEVAIINFKLDIMKIAKFPLSKDDVPDDIMVSICETFRQQCAALNIDGKKEHIYGLGVSVYSSFNQVTGKIGRPIGFYLSEQWSNYNLEQELRNCLELPLVIKNSTASAGLLEYFHRVSKNHSTMLYILCAMNIRSTVINDRGLLNNDMFYEDAFGHSTIDFTGKECMCGNYGCVNAYATIPAIMEHVSNCIKAGREIKHDLPQSLTIEKVCQGAEEGDSVCLEAINHAATMLGIGLANYINVMRPERVVLAGLLPNLSNIYYETCTQVAKKRIERFINADDIKFIKSGHFADPLAVSAGSMMIERLIS